jgi:PAS domain S-box-containing protein
LRESEKELLEAQRVAQVGSWLLEPETDKVLWSIELYRIAGRDPSLPPPAYEEQEQLYTPESWTRMRRSVAEALRNGTPYKLDLEMIRPDGTTRWIVDRGEALRDEAGRIVRLRGTAQDITERKRAEDSLRLFRALIDQSNDAIEVVDPDTLRLLDVNQRACTDLGYSREELLSMTVCELDPKVESMEVARARAQQDKPIIFESIHRRKDGSIFPVEVGLRFIRLDRLYCLAVVRDITQRKHADQTLSRQQNTVRGLFQLAKTLTSTMDLSAILDLLSCQPIQFVNADGAFAGLREEQEFACDSFVHRGISRKMAFKWPNHLGISRWILENKKTYVTNDAANDPLISTEVRQAISPRNLLCAPVFDSDAEVIGFLASYNKQKGDFGAEDVETIEGIAQVASIAIQNALAYRRAQQAEGDLRRLSSRLINSQDEERRRIARELHGTTAQDLAALRMSLGRIKRTNANLSAASKELIDDCLDLSNQVIGAVRTLSYLLHPPMLEEAGLQTAVAWYASGFSKRSGISVMVDLPDEVGRLPREYETTLFRIMQECLTNVHTHSGSQRARVRIGRENGFVYMEVQDDGKGIPSLSGGGESLGAEMGVGIAGIRERVKQFHGTLELDSAPGKGTTVRVILPAKKETPSKKSN